MGKGSGSCSARSAVKMNTNNTLSNNKKLSYAQRKKGLVIRQMTEDECVKHGVPLEIAQRTPPSLKKIVEIAHQKAPASSDDFKKKVITGEISAFSAVKNLNELLVGEDLVVVANVYDINIIADSGKKNKGWAGHTLERFLGFEINSLQAPDGGTWELKSVAMKLGKRGKNKGLWVPKETIKVTSINVQNIIDTPFEKSHVLNKLKHVVLAGREFHDINEPHSKLIRASAFSLEAHPQIYQQIKADYEDVQLELATSPFPSLDSLSSSMGILIQPRTSGAGHGMKSRSFYCRPEFVQYMLDNPSKNG